MKAANEREKHRFCLTLLKKVFLLNIVPLQASLLLRPQFGHKTPPHVKSCQTPPPQQEAWAVRDAHADSVGEPEKEEKKKKKDTHKSN